MNQFMQAHNLTYKQYVELSAAIYNLTNAKSVSRASLWAKAAILLNAGKSCEEVIEIIKQDND